MPFELTKEVNSNACSTEIGYNVAFIITISHPINNYSYDFNKRKWFNHKNINEASKTQGITSCTGFIDKDFKR